MVFFGNGNIIDHALHHHDATWHKSSPVGQQNIASPAIG